MHTLYYKAQWMRGVRHALCIWTGQRPRDPGGFSFSRHGFATESEHLAVASQYSLQLKVLFESVTNKILFLFPLLIVVNKAVQNKGYFKGKGKTNKLS